MTKQRFINLDGLRGLAALCVVIYHFAGRLNATEVMAHAYLAVDFFFVLSGLVVAHAYLDRLSTSLTAGTFMRVRLIRLLPMLVPGTLAGAVFELWRPAAEGSSHHLAGIIRAAILGSLAVPWPFVTNMEHTIFPINGPVWSVFFEVCASLMFVAIAKTCSMRLGAIILVLLGGLGCLHYAALVGRMDFGAELDTWIGGFPRVACSFFLGVLLSLNRHRFPPIAGWVPPVVVLLVFTAPGHLWGTNGVFDLVAALVIFPLLVGCASNTVVSPRYEAVCVWSGTLSYPLYAIHYPIVRVICFLLNRHPLPTAFEITVVIISTVAIAAISLILAKYYDEPVRRALTYMSRNWKLPRRGAKQGRLPPVPMP